VSAVQVKPCPFCGDTDPAIDEVELGVSCVVCNDCGCMGPIENYTNAQQSAERAIELWNKRGG
jgi:Lar family restriction alleviation protein